MEKTAVQGKTWKTDPADRALSVPQMLDGGGLMAVNFPRPGPQPIAFPLIASGTINVDFVAISACVVVGEADNTMNTYQGDPIDPVSPWQCQFGGFGPADARMPAVLVVQVVMRDASTVTYNVPFSAT
jgi:hypothetical protein